MSAGSRIKLTLRRIFASIPSYLHPPSNAASSKKKKPQTPPPPETSTRAREHCEAYYHSIFYSALRLLGFKIAVETSTSRGRIDAVLEHSDKIYVMEFKYAHCPPDAPPEAKRSLSEKTLDAAMEQITKKGYSDKYIGSGKTTYHVALAFLGRDDIEMRVSVRDAALGAPPPCAPLAVNEAAVSYNAATVPADNPHAATDKDAEIAEKDAEIARLRALLEQRG